MHILVAITGASGIIYGKKLIEELKKAEVEGEKHKIFVVVSEGAKKVAEAECEGGKGALPAGDFGENDLSAPFASGSFGLDAMAVCPCSLKTLGEIANGVGGNLITRAAEVMLKERHKLVLVVRETPLSYIAIKNMETVTLAGGIILPASPGFYHKPKTVGEMVNFVVGKTMDALGVQNSLFERWKGEK